jgi:Tfp pilus assembly protein PilV
MTMIEVCIALFLVGVGILALITLQPSALRLSGKSDYLGRASGILAAHLQALETQIINPNNTMPTSDSSPRPVYVSNPVLVNSGASSVQLGEAKFWVTRTITNLGNGTYRVNVLVTWTGNSVGVKESIIVAPQQSFAQ